jgi:hypothetical protein
VAVRVADDADARAVNLQRRRTADAWVLSDRMVAETTLLPTPDRIADQSRDRALPSRAAANLFWSRATSSAPRRRRLVRALVNRLTESDEATAGVVARKRTCCSALGARCRPTS